MSSVLVTGIGGNVAQGILRILRTEFPTIRIVGTDVETITSGHFYCDSFYQVPYSYENSYSQEMQKICQLEKIDLIIPSTDYEVFYLKSAQEKFPFVLASSPETSQLCLDKYLTSQEFKKANIIFAKTLLISEYHGQFQDYIVKPREGRGSRGLSINPKDMSIFDDKYIVQENLNGSELTSAFYISKKRKLLGPITFLRDLNHGMTSRCEVKNNYDDQFLDIAKKMVEHFDFLGPFNIQAKLVAEQIIPFEINCRYSGTNSIRSQLGFQDVKYGIQEYLFNLEPDQPTINQGSALRIYLDIVYPNKNLSEIEAGTIGAKIF
jgi:carbamoyl-phosphate synthase large subunit